MEKTEFETIAPCRKNKAAFKGVYDHRFQPDEVMRFSREESGTVFVYAKGKKNYGWRMDEDEFLQSFEPIVVSDADETAKWHKRMARAVKYLNGSGLWPEMKDMYLNLLTMNVTDWKAARDSFWASHGTDDGYAVRDKALLAKYPFLADADSFYFTEPAEARIKKMYFGSELDGKIARYNLCDAVLKHQAYHTGRIQAGYDVSAEYAPDKQKGWYSEEYRGCGNGHYYMMLDGVYAVFVEDD